MQSRCGRDPARPSGTGGLPAVKRFLTILATLAILALSFTSVSAVEPSNPRDAANLEPAEVGPVSSIDRQQKPSLGTGSEPRRYLVRFHDPAVPSYEGDKPGLAATTTRGVEKLDADSAPVVAYRSNLEAEQAEFIQRMERTAGHAVEVPFTYQYAVNGVAAVLTPTRHAPIAEDPGRRVDRAGPGARAAHRRRPAVGERRRAVERGGRARPARPTSRVRASSSARSTPASAPATARSPMSATTATTTPTRSAPATTSAPATRPTPTSSTPRSRATTS